MDRQACRRVHACLTLRMDVFGGFIITAAASDTHVLADLPVKMVKSELACASEVCCSTAPSEASFTL